MLVGRVYGHISNEHAQRAAKKVTFGNGTKEPKATETSSANPHDLSVDELLQILQKKMVKL